MSLMNRHLGAVGMSLMNGHRSLVHGRCRGKCECSPLLYVQLHCRFAAVGAAAGPLPCVFYCNVQLIVTALNVEPITGIILTVTVYLVCYCAVSSLAGQASCGNRLHQHLGVHA